MIRDFESSSRRHTSQFSEVPLKGLRAERERFKKRLLDVSAVDLRRITAAYLSSDGHAQATVAGPELIESATKERPGLFEVVAPV